MTRSLIPDAELRRLAQRLTELQGRLDVLERGIRATQLGDSSLENSSIVIRDASGLPRGTIGMQTTGNSGVRTVNNPAPDRPNTPELTPTVNGIAVGWNGDLISGPPQDGNFRHVNVYVSGAGPDFIHGPSNLAGSLSRAGALIVAPLEPGQDYWARFVAENRDDPVDLSEPSFTGGPVQPLAVVADDVLDGIITETKLAAGAVTEAKLAAGAVTETKVADDAISTPKLVAGAVQTDKIAAGAVQAGTIAAGAVTAEKVAALAVTADKIAANAVAAGHIQAGAVDADKLAAQLVVAGTPGGNRVEISQVNGIEQWLDGNRTLWVPPEGSSEFSGGVTTGTANQFIRLDPGDVTGYPRVLIQDDTSTRRIAMYYHENALWLRRETIAAGIGQVRGGQISMGSGSTFVSHYQESNGTPRAGLDFSDSSAILHAKDTAGTITARLSMTGAEGHTWFEVDGQLIISAGLGGSDNIYIQNDNGDIYLDTGAGAALRLFASGTAQLISGGVVKSFVIPHPVEPEDRWLVHGCTESPQAGVEYWGEATIRGGVAEVPLPGYFEALTRPNRHVFVTPVAPDDLAEWAKPVRPAAPQVGELSSLRKTRERKERRGQPPTVQIPRVAASTPRGGKFSVYSDGPDGSVVNWLVKAERHVDFEVEPLKTDVDVTGSGPYLTTTPRSAA